MRARMALYVSGQIFEIREVKLKNKPIELIELSPKGTVPVLALSTGEMFEQSLDIMCWALRKNDPLNWLAPEHGDLESMVDFIEMFDNDFKFNLDRYKYPQRYEIVDALIYRQECERFIEILDKLLNKNVYLFGRQPSLVDYAILPFVRQFANTDRDWFDSLPYSILKGWLGTLLNDRPFINIMDKYPAWELGNKPIIFAGPAIKNKNSVSDI